MVGKIYYKHHFFCEELGYAGGGLYNCNGLITYGKCYPVFIEERYMTYIFFEQDEYRVSLDFSLPGKRIWTSYYSSDPLE